MSLYRRISGRTWIYRQGIPFPAARFFDRASRLAKKDPRGRFIMTPHKDFVFLIELAKRRRRCVEIGTGVGTTAIGLALAESKRTVWTYDPMPHDEVATYAALASSKAVRRIHFVYERGDAPSRPPHGVDFLFIDSSHARAEVVSEFETWRPQLAPGAIVAFHDYWADWPGVIEAIDEDLRLTGEVHHDVFVWRNDAHAVLRS